MNWKSISTPLNSNTVQLQIEASEGNPLSFREFFQLCERNEFSDFWTENLLGVNRSGFFWELPPMTLQVVDDPFECVVVGSDVLSGLTANPGPFGNQFNGVESDETIVVFENLGRDALLIVPLPKLAGHDAYAHIASFLREGPPRTAARFLGCYGAGSPGPDLVDPFLAQHGRPWRLLASPPSRFASQVLSTPSLQRMFLNTVQKKTILVYSEKW